MRVSKMLLLSGIIGFGILFGTIIYGHKPAQARQSCYLTSIGDGCAADEACYVKRGSSLGGGVCLPVTIVKSVP